MDTAPILTAPPAAPLSILLVDDDPRNLLTLNAVLDGLDARLVPAHSGGAALRALLREDFALILLDVRMPDMDGFETAALIRQRLRSAHTPIIFVTGDDASRARMQEGYRVGAADYIVKPLDPDVLRSKVSIFLELHRKTEEIRRQAEMLRLADEREHRRKLDALAAEERRRADAAMRALVERQAMVLEAVPLAVYTAAADAPGRLLSITGNVQRLTGFPPELLTAESDFWLSRVHPDDRDVLLALRTNVHETGGRSAEYRWRCADGRYRWFLDHAVPGGHSQGAAEIAGTWLDITERRETEHALTDAHARLEARAEKLRVTLGSIADGVITTDTELRVGFMSRTAERLTGHPQSEVEGLPLASVFVATEEGTNLPVDIVAALNGPTPQATALLHGPDGARLIHFHAAPIRAGQGGAMGIVLVFRDITDLRRRDEEVFKASKLESIGVLAGGIAHDFNNLLTGIMASVSVAELKVARGLPPGGSLKQALAACDRAQKLTRQLLTFSRGGAPVKALVRLGPVVADAAAFALQGSRSRAVVQADPDVPAVEADVGQIGQVVQNLVLNADQAMPQGGTVFVRLRTGTPGPDGPPPRAGGYAVLSVTDEGPGIATEHLPKIFDPFFTTRQGGSGLGLATVYSIVQHHGGRVQVASPPGSGATFTVWLPAAPGGPVDTPAALPELVGGGRERVLVMDDEPAVRVAAEEALTLLGYDVTLARDGAEAFACYQVALQEETPFEAVIMDLTVRGSMGGVEAARRIREVDPQARMLVSTGYSTDPVVSAPEAYGFCGVVPKPWDIAGLDQTLRQVIGPRWGAS